ncbi:hypothetical protein M3084_00730 [Succinatimonas hippei]|uniref:hypothetical protein n=1 Tax=Succinatimonas hippei TaxID=626938 RepID=UPI0020127934|nr:hypothetical protein [Succinatimonas hippei]MCL1602382.1 hypothetical protein [Succinatimonas hippei]
MSICIAGVKHLLVALLFIVFTTYNSFAAGTFEDQVYEEFKSSINSDEVYDAALNSFHFKSEAKRQLLKEHLILLFSNDALVDEFWLELKSLLGRPITNNPNDINLIVKNSALVAMSYVENLSTKGMLRLSANERKEYFMQTYEITNFMDDRTCAAFQFGNDFIDPLKIREVLIDYYNSLSDAEVRHKLALVRKAVFAELDKYPMPKIITSNDLYLADQAMSSALENWAATASKEEIQNFVLVLSNPSAYSYRDQCHAAKTFLEIVIGMDGAYADINRIQILQSIIR